MKKLILFILLASAYVFPQADSTLFEIQTKTTTATGDVLLMGLATDSNYFKITYGNFLAEVFADVRGDGTVSNGDDTKYPTEDDVYGFVTGLGYITDGNTNWNNTYGFYSTAEEIEDIIGAMLTGNTETNITVTYQDADGTIDFVVTGGTGLDSATVLLTIYQYLADSSYVSVWTGDQMDSLLNILHTNDGLWLTSVPNDAVTMDKIDDDGNFTSLTGNWQTTGYLSGGVRTHTITTDSTLASGLMYGGVFYVPEAQTITLPAVAVGMSATFITIGAVAVSVDVNASDKVWLDGTALADGDKVTNTSTTGDIIVFTYYSADGWYAVSGSNDGDPWTDGN